MSSSPSPETRPNYTPTNLKLSKNQSKPFPMNFLSPKPTQSADKCA